MEKWVSDQYGSVKNICEPKTLVETKRNVSTYVNRTVLGQRRLNTIRILPTDIDLI
ncbi:hypothetical protein OGM63_28705 [Plectonema radiosum NIES-515]|uniref:Uncharacterized protein n=1 Tax=Plectonema radiosum NIES-515 TaxID=2986073 RepID=A0ABT3B7T5_9CYAN|nr:hypothetical protein [Plectonema radiosum]MCV3217441.1 hypothetical protein [Plectonema radiosum NIES-515]